MQLREVTSRTDRPVDQLCAFGRELAQRFHVKVGLLVNEDDDMNIEHLRALTQGDGKKFMAEFVKLADQFPTVSVYLNANPMNDNTWMDRDKLVAWYRQFGFIEIGEDPDSGGSVPLMMMKRKPKPTGEGKAEAAKKTEPFKFEIGRFGGVATPWKNMYRSYNPEHAEPDDESEGQFGKGHYLAPSFDDALTFDADGHEVATFEVGHPKVLKIYEIEKQDDDDNLAMLKAATKFTGVPAKTWDEFNKKLEAKGFGGLAIYYGNYLGEFVGFGKHTINGAVLAKSEPRFHWKKEIIDEGDGFEINVTELGTGKEVGNITIQRIHNSDTAPEIETYEEYPEVFDTLNAWEMLTEIRHLNVEDDFQGQGVGKYIYNLALQEIKKRYPNDPVFINASPMGGDIDLESLIAFYTKAGFKVLKKFTEHRNAALWIEDPKKIKLVAAEDDEYESYDVDWVELADSISQWVDHSDGESFDNIAYYSKKLPPDLTTCGDELFRGHSGTQEGFEKLQAGAKLKVKAGSWSIDEKEAAKFALGGNDYRPNTFKVVFKIETKPGQVMLNLQEAVTHPMLEDKLDDWVKQRIQDEGEVLLNEVTITKDNIMPLKPLAKEVGMDSDYEELFKEGKVSAADKDQAGIADTDFPYYHVSDHPETPTVKIELGDKKKLRRVPIEPLGIYLFKKGEEIGSSAGYSKKKYRWDAKLSGEKILNLDSSSDMKKFSDHMSAQAFWANRERDGIDYYDRRVDEFVEYIDHHEMKPIEMSVESFIESGSEEVDKAFEGWLHHTKNYWAALVVCVFDSRKLTDLILEKGYNVVHDYTGFAIFMDEPQYIVLDPQIIQWGPREENQVDDEVYKLHTSIEFDWSDLWVKTQVAAARVEGSFVLETKVSSDHKTATLYRGIKGMSFQDIDPLYRGQGVFGEGTYYAMNAKVSHSYMDDDQYNWMLQYEFKFKNPLVIQSPVDIDLNDTRHGDKYGYGPLERIFGDDQGTEINTSNLSGAAQELGFDAVFMEGKVDGGPQVLIPPKANPTFNLKAASLFVKDESTILDLESILGMEARKDPQNRYQWFFPSIPLTKLDLVQERLDELNELAFGAVQTADYVGPVPSPNDDYDVYQGQHPMDNVWNGISIAGKQVGVLYHFTTPLGFYQIVEDGWKLRTVNREQLSFTRDFDLKFMAAADEHDEDDESTGNTHDVRAIVRITVDGDVLSHKYKIKPFADGGPFAREGGNNESEQIIPGTEADIGKAVLQVDMLNGFSYEKEYGEEFKYLDHNREDVGPEARSHGIEFNAVGYFTPYLSEDRIASATNDRDLSTVYHVGALDAGRKKPDFSLEGNGLSVSQDPEAWTQIARLGGQDTYKLTKKNPKFYFADRTDKKAIAWGLKNRFLVPQEKFLAFTSDEDGEERYMEFDTREEAEQEITGVEDARVEHETDGVGFGPKGIEYWGKAFSSPVRNNMAEDLAPVFFAEANGYDGVWWEEELDPENFSAPRGVIFQGKLSSWKKEKIDPKKAEANGGLPPMDDPLRSMSAFLSGLNERFTAAMKKKVVQKQIAKDESNQEDVPEGLSPEQRTDFILSRAFEEDYPAWMQDLETNGQVEGENIILYRGVSTDSPEHIDTQKLGVYWTWHPEKAANYSDTNTGKPLYIVKAKVPFSSINFDRTLVKLVWRGYTREENEREFELKPNTPLQIVSIDGEEVDKKATANGWYFWESKNPYNGLHPMDDPQANVGSPTERAYPWRNEPPGADRHPTAQPMESAAQFLNAVQEWNGKTKLANGIYLDGSIYPFTGNVIDWVRKNLNIPEPDLNTTIQDPTTTDLPDDFYRIYKPMVCVDLDFTLYDMIHPEEFQDFVLKILLQRKPLPTDFTFNTISPVKNKTLLVTDFMKKGKLSLNAISNPKPTQDDLNDAFEVVRQHLIDIDLTGFAPEKLDQEIDRLTLALKKKWDQSLSKAKMKTWKMSDASKKFAVYDNNRRVKGKNLENPIVVAVIGSYHLILDGNHRFLTKLEKGADTIDCLMVPMPWAEELTAMESMPVESGLKVDFHTVMCNAENCVPGDLVEQFKQVSLMIPNDALYGEHPYKTDSDGRETEPHVTVLYGLKNDADLPAIAKYAATLPPIEFTIGKVSAFRNADKPYDVLKIAVNSPSMEKLHYWIRENFDNACTFPFSGHMTLAYIKKGTCQDLEGPCDWTGAHYTCDVLTFSHKTEGHSDFPMDRIDQERVAAEMVKAVEVLTPWTTNWPKRISAQDVVNYYASTEANPINRDYHLNWMKRDGFNTWVLKDIPVADIQSHRLGKDPDTDKRIDQYTKLTKKGSLIPPLIAIPNVMEDTKYRTIDGSHRLAAAKKAGLKKIRAYVPEIKTTASEFKDEGMVDGNWGSQASGILFKCGPRILLLKRAHWTLDPLLWGIPGGAVPVAEGKPMDVKESAEKETAEEIGGVPGDALWIDKVIFQDGKFQYTTFLVEVSEEFEPILNDEHIGFAWSDAGFLPGYIHPGVEWAVEQFMERKELKGAA